MSPPRHIDTEESFAAMVILTCKGITRLYQGVAEERAMGLFLDVLRQHGFSNIPEEAVKVQRVPDVAGGCCPEKESTR